MSRQEEQGYRGWAVTWDYGYYSATSPDYDASYESEEDGWQDNGQRVTGRTLDDLHCEVDGWFEDNAPAAADARKVIGAIKGVTNPVTLTADEMQRLADEDDLHDARMEAAISKARTTVEAGQ